MQLRRRSPGELRDRGGRQGLQADPDGGAAELAEQRAQRVRRPDLVGAEREHQDPRPVARAPGGVAQHVERGVVDPVHVLHHEDRGRRQGQLRDGGGVHRSHPGRIHSEAAFAALAGVAPLPASSGNTRRHRLNRGGDRRLNRALYTVALTRLGHDPRTRDYLARRTTEDATRREIIRILKRYISRELFRLLSRTQTHTVAT